MTAILRTESKQLYHSSILLTVVFAVIAAFFLAVFPAMRAEAEFIEEAYPDFMVALLGFEAIHTIEGFSAGYIYPLIWVLFGGTYFAYLSGGFIARDIQTRKMDLTLSNPVSRESVLIQKVAALWVPLLILNIGVMVIVYGGALIVGEQFDLTGLLMVHILSIPYLLVCAGIGIVLSVFINRVTTAQVAALGIVFMLWLMEGISMMQPDYEWIGEVMPSRYYDPTEILVHEEYAFMDATILLMAFFLLIVIAIIQFSRRDI